MALDARMYRKGTKDINRTNLRLRLLVLIAVATGMRRGEIFRFEWGDILYKEGLIVVRAKLKKARYALCQCLQNSQKKSVDIRPSWDRIAFCLPSRAQPVGVSVQTRVSMNCSSEQRYETFGSTICATRCFLVHDVGG